jgi:hypothetical protein
VQDGAGGWVAVRLLFSAAEANPRYFWHMATSTTALGGFLLEARVVDIGPSVTSACAGGAPARPVDVAVAVDACLELCGKGFGCSMEWESRACSFIAFLHAWWGCGASVAAREWQTGMVSPYDGVGRRGMLCRGMVSTSQGNGCPLPTHCPLMPRGREPGSGICFARRVPVQ